MNEISHLSNRGNGYWTTLVICSGGMDSIGMLYDLLQDTDDEIFVMHVAVKRPNGRWVYEMDAFNSCMGWLTEHCRHFTVLPIHNMDVNNLQMWHHDPETHLGNKYTGLFTGHTKERGIIPDNNVVLFYAAHIAQYLHCDRVAYGRVEGDGFYSYAREYWRRSEAIFNLMTIDYPVKLIYPNLDGPTKREQMDRLPHELIKKTVVCRLAEFEGPEIGWTDCNDQGRMPPCYACRRKVAAALGITDTRLSDDPKNWMDGTMDWPELYEKARAVWEK